MAQNTPVECPGVRSVNTTTADPTAIPLPTLLRLPRELRDLIYEEYVRVDGGYIYKPETNRLAHADGSPINLSLRLVCRQLASELHGMALKLNTITFETCFSEASREDAGMHHAINTKIERRKREVMKMFAPQLFTSEMARAVADVHPWFSPVINGWSRHSLPDLKALTMRGVYCGEAPSLWRDCVHDVFRQISKSPELNATLLEESVARPRPTALWPQPWIPADGQQLLELAKADPKPWQILSRAERDKLAAAAHAEPKLPHYKSRTKYTYSAASLALRFLQALSPSDLAAVRQVKLLETRETVGFPECHARGFIPICQQCPQIRIHRFASLWKSVFSVPLLQKADYCYASQDEMDSSIMSIDRLAAKDITREVGKWAIEASILPSLGMPEECFTLVLDGEPTPAHTTKLFRVVQEDMAFQDALDLAYNIGSLPLPTWLDRRIQTGYMYEGLPDIIRSLSIGSPLIRCNFDPDQPHDARKIMEKRHGWNLSDWTESWSRSREYQTVAPLPPWHELRWQYVIV
ncbi:uncharacterized protein J4E79_009552 [Alternaria viburni]|uniref:uncharacterized protein n=1 Tax=Alternaria viburni TaxID=566460 RepID=UPI0020C34946|nr:uncharacterized protein J4E79_009552 [Alternaria viburni]KAI4650284.1 hypothetical protein J4E79_009552 [Alternaria viburni]